MAQARCCAALRGLMMLTTAPCRGQQEACKGQTAAVRACSDPRLDQSGSASRPPWQQGCRCHPSMHQTQRRTMDSTQGPQHSRCLDAQGHIMSCRSETAPQPPPQQTNTCSHTHAGSPGQDGRNTISLSAFDTLEQATWADPLPARTAAALGSLTHV